MTFTYRLEQHTEQPDDNEPLDVKVVRQAKVITDQQVEIARLTAAVRRLEREGVERRYWHNCHARRADGRYEEF